MKTLELTGNELEMLQDELFSIIGDEEALSGDTDYIKELKALYRKLSSRPAPKQHEIYKHFKGKFYVITAVGHHSETGEKMVIYHDIADENSSSDDPCIRPLDMFMSEVDHEKYPEVTQKYRFEKVDPSNQ